MDLVRNKCQKSPTRHSDGMFHAFHSLKLVIFEHAQKYNTCEKRK